MKKPKYLIDYKVFNKKFKNPYIFICGGRSHSKTFALKQMMFKEVENEK